MMYTARYFQAFLNLNVAAQCARRQLSTSVVRIPSRNAPREVPTPLVFCSSSEWDANTRRGMSELASKFCERGYTCIESDLELPRTCNTDSQQLMHHFESGLQSDIKLSGLPFPPIIFTRGSASLISQTFVSSNPASGLLLISPPPSNVSLPKHLLPSALKEFDFELTFPLAIIASAREIENLKASSRFGRDGNVVLIEVEDVEKLEAFEKIQQWLDELGI